MPRSRSLPAALSALAVAATVALTAATTAPASTDTQSHAASRVRQTAKLLMHPQIAQAGSTVKSASGALSSMTATFKPARKGRVVALQRKKAGRWVTVARKRQDRKGIAEFNAPFKVRGKVAVYRALTAKKGALAAKASAKVSANKWGGADLVDEFGGTTMSDMWSDRVQGFGETPDRECSRTGEDSARLVSGGALRLSVIRDAGPNALLQPKCTYAGNDYTWRANGHVSTEDRHAFRYGYAAARMKFQRLAGQHASFWLQPQTRSATTGPARDTGAEIDVIEWFGDRSDNGAELSSFIHHYPDAVQDTTKRGVEAKKEGGLIRGASKYGSDWYSKYHVFSVEWTPTQYIFRIDGKETTRISQGVSGRPQFLILSLLSSDYELPLFKASESKFAAGNASQHMYVDWVRYWTR